MSVETVEWFNRSDSRFSWMLHLDLCHPMSFLIMTCSARSGLPLKCSRRSIFPPFSPLTTALQFIFPTLVPKRYSTTDGIARLICRMTKQLRTNMIDRKPLRTIVTQRPTKRRCIEHGQTSLAALILCHVHGTDVPTDVTPKHSMSSERSFKRQTEHKL